MCVETEEQLKRSFRDVGMKYGYEIVEAEFAAFKDFKVRWERGYRTASFQVSDYMADAPSDVMECLAESVFSRIVGFKKKPYTESMRNWVLSGEFIMNKQPMYLKRNRNITGDTIGLEKDLSGSLRRLKDLGLIDEDADPVLRWTKEALPKSVGYCSPVMNVIVISSYFDDCQIPDYILDFVVLHEYLLMDEGRRCFGDDFDGSHLKQERKFRQHAEAQRWITRAGLYC